MGSVEGLSKPDRGRNSCLTDLCPANRMGETAVARVRGLPAVSGVPYYLYTKAMAG